MGFLYFNQRRWSTMFISFFLFLMVASNFQVGRMRYEPSGDSYIPYAPPADPNTGGETTKSILGTTDWFMWLVLLIWFLILYIVDLMFLTDREFVYDPNYSSWLEKCGYEHFRT